MPGTETSKLIVARNIYWFEKARQSDFKHDESFKKEEEDEAQSYWGGDYKPWRDIAKDILHDNQLT